MDYKHIKTIKQPSPRNNILVEDTKTFIKKASFAVETETILNELSDAEFQHASRIAGNSYSGTFAQRARAAELQAARTLRESKIHSESATSPPPITQRETLTLKMPRRQKWTPLDLTAPAETYSEIAAPVTSSSVGQPHQNKPQLQKNEATERVSERLVEKATARHQDHYSLKPFAPLPGSTIQPHDLSEYPVELGARISSEFPPKPHLQTFQPMDNQRFITSQAQAGNVQASEQNNKTSGQPQNTYFAEMSAPHRDGEQPGLADQFARARAAPSRQLPAYAHQHNNKHYSAQPVDHVPGVGINPISMRSYPAVKGTPTAVENNTGIPPVYSHNLQGFQGQNYNPMSSQGFEHVARGSPHNGNHPMAQQQHASFGDTNFLSGGPFFQGGMPSYPSYQRDPNLSPQAAIYGQQFQPFQPFQPFQAAANMANNGHDSKDNFVPRGNPLHIGERYLQFERDLESCVATNPFNPKEKLTRRQERDKMEKELDEWWNRDARFPSGELRHLEELVANERRARMQKPNPFGPIGNNKHGNTEPKPNTIGVDEDEDGDAESKDKGKEKADAIAPYSNDELVNELLLPAMANLLSYKTDKKNLNPFGPPPSWAIDHTPGGNESFFSQQWGQPPQRVGRDPRYRAMQHDGRSSVFEDPTGRFPREEFTHDRGRGRAGGPGAGRGAVPSPGAGRGAGLSPGAGRGAGPGANGSTGGSTGGGRWGPSPLN